MGARVGATCSLPRTRVVARWGTGGKPLVASTGIGEQIFAVILMNPAATQQISFCSACIPCSIMFERHAAYAILRRAIPNGFMGEVAWRTHEPA